MDFDPTRLLGLLSRLKYVKNNFTTNAISYCILEKLHAFIKKFT